MRILFFPKLNITRENILDFLPITNVKCKSKELQNEGIISWDYCQDCIHYKDCVMWNDENFLKFYQRHKCCEKCKNQEELLNRGYVLYCWQLQKAGLLPKKYQLQCCSCLRLQDMQSS